MGSLIITYALPLFKVEATILESYYYISNQIKFVKDLN
jgi:hypothetical protein